MNKRYPIRQAVIEDYDAIANVMYDAVRYGRSAYSEEQRQAWVPEPRSGADWIARLNSQTIFVAQDSEQVVGFMSLAENGYLDFAYIRPAAQGSGIFRSLFQAIEDLATQAGQRKLRVHASLTGQPAFSAIGFTITQTETVEIGGQSLKRFAMEKHLALPKSATET